MFPDLNKKSCDNCNHQGQKYKKCLECKRFYRHIGDHWERKKRN